MGELKPILLMLIILAGFPIPGLADMDERGFAAYNSGTLQQQAGWYVDRYEEKHWLAAPERVEVVKDADSGKQYVKFKPGFGGKDQSRLVKEFPATDKPLVIITLDFQPGAATVGGRLYFSEARAVSATALRFENGTVRIMEEGPEKKTVDTDTGILFNPNDWNHFELRLDFNAHKCEVFLNQASIGVFKMNSAAGSINQLIFYGGGTTFASLLGNVSVVSVDKFSVK